MKYLITLPCLAIVLATSAQTFTDASSLYNFASPRTGGPVGVADMDGDGYDDIIILDDAENLFIDYQESNGTFTLHSYGSVSTANQWGMTVGDIQNDGHKDLISGGSNSEVNYVEIDSRGVFTNTNLADPLQFMQGCNMVDVNNDGWLEFFGLDDVNKNRLWVNDGAGNLSYDNDNLIDWDLFGTASLNRGNYGSTWTDFDQDGDIDLYIAKCRQGENDPNHVARINQLFENDGAGNFTQTALSNGLVPYEQSWSADFADIDNDGDFDCVITNHSETILLYENDGTGSYTDITFGSGLAYSAFFLQSIFEDFDNDGFVDLLLSGGSNADKLFKNDGDNTFTEVANPFPYPDPTEVGHSFGLGDLNHDGFVDVYMGFGGGYVTPDSDDNDALFLNDGNSNHFLSVELEGVTSNRDAVGATMISYGPWGTMLREVRAGESYGIVTSFTQIFGLGAETTVDSLVIIWPSGTKDKLSNVAADQFLRISEGETTRLKLNAKLLLEGPYDGGGALMNDDLRSMGLVPAIEPYTGLGFQQVEGGGETVAPSVLITTGSNAIVDWVMVEVRDANDNTIIVATRSALVQRDGDVVDVDGTSAITINLPEGQFVGNYYVVVRHRNHFGCMTGNAIAFNSTSTASLDLTSPATATWGTDARKMQSGAALLWAGETNRDAELKYTGGGNDRDPILLAIGGAVPTNTTNGYLSTDVNLDGTVQYTGADNDRDPILVNIGGAVPTNTRTEQLP